MVDIDYLARTYFYFDKPVIFQLRNKQMVTISPVKVTDSEIFLSSAGVLQIDKNSMPSVEIIQMSYLQFLYQYVFLQTDDEESNKKARHFMDAFVNILCLCLGFRYPDAIVDNKGKICIVDKEYPGVIITSKDFDDIKKIILHQNLYKYDDTYINPEAKKAMAEVDAIKNQDIAPISIERKMAIISAHTGISKKEQMEMTFRSHSILFEEVTGEVEFSTSRNAALLGGGAKEFEHWIFKKKKGKYQEYFVSDKAYHKSMGGDGNIAPTLVDQASNYSEQFDNFKK